MSTKSKFEEYLNNVLEGKKNDWNSSELDVLKDVEVNILVANVYYKSLHKKVLVIQDIPGRNTVNIADISKPIGEDEEGIEVIDSHDFCNVANDAYLIIFKNDIGFRKNVLNNKWTATVDVKKEDNYISDICATNKNPLRASMHVYLLKKA